MDKIKDISLLFFICGYRSPDALAPAHTGISTSALRYPPVYHNRTNLSFSLIVRRLKFRLAQKSEIIISSIALEPPGQRFGKFMIRWPSHSFQKTGFDSFHRAGKTSISKHISAVQCVKQLFKPFKQFTAPAGKFSNFLLGQKTNVSNQMGQAVPHANVKQAGVFAISPPSNQHR